MAHFSLECFTSLVVLVHCHPNFKLQVLGYLLPMLSSTSYEFFSITQNADEFSMFIPISYAEKLVQELGHIVTIMPNKYKVLRMYQDSHKIDEYGVVKELSSFFTEKNIPILYINSFNNNYVLYPEHLDHLLQFDENWIEF